jgi:nucleotide-binding universal stress UspA family protein
MKKILIATDFSCTAHNAVLYGTQLATAMKADVVLFSAYQVTHLFPALSVPGSHLAVMDETKQRLADEVDSLRKEYDVQFETVCKEGAPSDAILAITKEKEVDLIVIGMTGSGKSLKKLFGSVAISLANSLTIPVVIVPEGAGYTTPKNILYASDVFLDTTIAGVDRVKWLTDFFGSKLFVVRVVKDDYEEVRENVNTPQNLRKELKVLKTSFRFPVNENITDGLNEFMSEQTVDLMVMPRKHQWIEGHFVNSETKDILFHSHVPILMLPNTNVDVINTGNLQVIENYR